MPGDGGFGEGRLGEGRPGDGKPGEGRLGEGSPGTPGTPGIPGTPGMPDDTGGGPLQAASASRLAVRLAHRVPLTCFIAIRLLPLRRCIAIIDAAIHGGTPPSTG